MDSEILTKGEQTRKQIVLDAHDLFLKQGFHGTSMRQIAKAANIALSGIYNHFANKEEIFEAVYLTYHPYNQIVPAVKTARGDTVEMLLRDIARLLTEGLDTNPDYLNLMFIDLVEFQNKYTTKLLENQLPHIIRIYESIAQAAHPSLRPIPPLIVMRSFFGLFFSYYITGIFLRSSSTIPTKLNEHAFDYFVEIYLHGIISNDPFNKSEVEHG
jgi:AcrR family transcriptional regulator